VFYWRVKACRGGGGGLKVVVVVGNKMLKVVWGGLFVGRGMVGWIRGG